MLALFILFLWLIWKQVFFLVSPDFKFYLTPATKQYKNDNNELIDIDSYLELTTKYCDNFKQWDKFNYKYTRESMCAWKFEPNLKTVQEYIKVLDYANKHNFKYLYLTTFRWADDNVWLDNLIEQYNDDTFYAYVIWYTSNIDFLNLIKKNINNKDLEMVLDYYIEKNNYYWNNKNSFTQNEWEEYWHILSEEIEKKLQQISKINKKIF